MTLPFLWEAVPRTREFCREAREAGVPPCELYLRRKAEYMQRVMTMDHDERRAEVLAFLRSHTQPVTRECIWPQLRAALDELVAEGRVRAQAFYDLAERRGAK